MSKCITILGATGSIGSSTLDLISQHPDKYRAFAVSAYDNVEKMADICQRFRPKYAVMVDDIAATELRVRTASLSDISILSGMAALNAVSVDQEVDIVVAGIVGAAGLSSAVAAAQAGKKILLANKESLVIAGELFIQAVQQNGATLIPIDSEHNAIFQSLPDEYRCGQRLSDAVSRILLTASGGPFRGCSKDELRSVSPEMACRHPNWSMGKKISVDSATLMNKGLELIEACRLFCVEPSQIDVHVHPESIVHSMVEYCDGSIIAQLGTPDMRIPIAHGLAFPERIAVDTPSLDLFALGSLTFEPPDIDLFPCLQLAKACYIAGGSAPTVLNAANEMAVDAFLKGNISFLDIPDMIRRSLDAIPVESVDSLDTIYRVDGVTRRYISELIANQA